VQAKSLRTWSACQSVSRRRGAPDTACSSLGRLLQLGAVDEVELYRALDWLGARQAAIEGALARRHLKDGALVLYDVSSSWLEGRCCELARFGYARDGKKGKLQIVYGLLCAADGCPVAVEVFEGNTADPMTLSAQIDKLKERFGLSRVVLVGDRGMITSARIRDELRPAGLDWTVFDAADAARDLILARGAGAAGDLIGQLGQRRLGGVQQILALAGAFLGQQRVAADDQTFAREIGGGDLGQSRARRTARAGRRRRRPKRGICGARSAVILQARQAVRHHRRRRRLHLWPQPRPHRRRGPARRLLCHPHQRRGQSLGGGKRGRRR
jgi:hypothetical protein